MANTPLFSSPFSAVLEQRPFLFGFAFDNETRKRSLLNVLSLIGTFFLVFLGYLAYVQGGLQLAAIDFSVAGVLVGLLYLLRKKGYLNFCIYCTVSLVFFLYLYLFINGGMAGNAFLWSFTLPLITFLLLGTRKGFFVIATYYLSCLAVLLLDLNTGFAIDLYTKAFAFRFLASFAVVIIFTFIYELFWEHSQRELINLNDQLEQKVAKRTAELQQEVKKTTKAQEEWERTFDAVPDEITILDTDYRVVRGNKAMVKSANVPLKEFVGLKCHQIVHGTEAPPSCCPYSMLLENHKSHQHDFFDDNTQRYL